MHPSIDRQVVRRGLKVLADREDVAPGVHEISHRLGDNGIAAYLIVAWDRQSSASDRRRYH
jgi:hypothetical protein